MRVVFLLIFTFQFMFAYELLEVNKEFVKVLNSGFIKTDKNLSEIEAYKLFKSDEFEKFPKENKAFGFNRDSFWFAFEVSIKEKSESLYLNIHHLLDEKCELYTFIDDKLIKKEQNGYLTPINEREIKTLPIRFKLENSNKIATYILKIKSNHPYLISFNMDTKDNLNNKQFIEYAIYIFFLGVILSLLTYNIILFISTKDRVYFFYILFMSGSIIYLSSTKGYIVLLSDSLAKLTAPFIMIGTQIEIIGLVFFASYFLNLKKFSPKLNRAIFTILVINIISMFSLGVIKEFEVIAFLSLYILFILLIYVGVKSYRSGFKPALYYLIATGICLITFILYMFMIQGILIDYNLFNYHLPTIGIMWDAIFLSLALAYRIKALEIKARENERLLMLQSRQNCIGELTGNIAHQWREPLSEIGSIMTKLEAKIKYDKISNEEILNSLSNSSKILKHLSETITTFQGFFQNRDTIGSFDINEEIKKSVEFVYKSLTNNNISIEYKIEAKARVKGDANEFSQALLNIILNAKDILIERKVKNPKIEIISKVENSSVIVEIRDNGEGIKVEPIEKIFDSFISYKEGGSGMGLFITKNIIEKKLNGKVEVKNSKIGAVFKITTPITNETVKKVGSV